MPRHLEQALRTGASRAVALLVPDMTNPFFSRVLRGAQRAAAEAGYVVILVDTQNDRHWESQSFEALRAGPVDGYLLFEVAAPDALGPDENVVMMETEAPGRPSVRFDGEAGATAAFEHLVELGHRRVGHLAAAFRALDVPAPRGGPAAGPDGGRARPGCAAERADSDQHRGRARGTGRRSSTRSPRPCSATTT